MKYQLKTSQGQVIGVIELAEGLEVVAEATAPPAPPQPPQMEEVKLMTDLAGAFTYDQYKEMGWSDNAMVAQGVMKIEMRQLEETAPGDLHPSVKHQQLGQDWQPEPPAAVPQPPAPPQATHEVASVPPAAPTPPEATQTAPGVPSVPGVPTPPPGTGALVSPTQLEPASHLAEGLSRVQGQVPRIEGREFMLKGVSYENIVDSEGVLFDGRIHSVTTEHVPSLKAGAKFKKRRNLGEGVFEQVQEQLLDALRVERRHSPAPTAPTPPAAPGVPSVPNVPQAQTAPQTAPPQPDNMEALKDALSDWGEEV